MWLLGANYTACPASLGPADREGPWADCAQGRNKLHLGDELVQRATGRASVGAQQSRAETKSEYLGRFSCGKKMENDFLNIKGNFSLLFLDADT